MTDTCAIELRVSLPRPLAAEVERVQAKDPEMLSQILAYGMTRRAIYEYLVSRVAGEERADPSRS